MASTYVNNLRLDEMATGDGSGTWGTTTNTNLTLIGEAFGYATKAIADASTATLTIPDGTETDSEPRAMYLKLTGGGQACTVTLAPNTASKVWIIENVTSYTLSFTQGSGANVDILAGETKMIATDGAGSGAVVYDVLTDLNLAGTTKTAALTNAGALSNQGTVTVGVDDTGYDVKLFGATSGKYWLWDESADGVLQYSTLTVGVDDTGYDVKFFGATSGAYMLWDESADDLVLAGAAGLDIAGDIDVDGTANLDIVDIDGAVDMASTLTLADDFNVESGTFFVDVSNNNVGLGTTSPATGNAGNTAGLHIKNSAPFIRLQDDTSTAADWEMYAFDHALYFYDNEDSAAALTLDGGGNVGINDGTPSQTLVVDASSGANVMVARSASGTGGVYLESDGTNGVIRNPAAQPLKLQTGGDNTRMSVTTNGLCFGTDTAAANALDDYEEGTWTPTLSSDASAGAYSIQNGYYTKIGRQVNVSATVKISTIGSFAGAVVNLGGLPFTVGDLTNYDVVGITGISDAASEISKPFLRFIDAQTYARVEQGNGNTGTDRNLNANTIDTDTTIRIAGTYFTV